MNAPAPAATSGNGACMPVLSVAGCVSPLEDTTPTLLPPAPSLATH